MYNVYPYGLSYAIACEYYYAYDYGWMDYEDGYDLDDNPYPIGSWAAKEWQWGWWDAYDYDWGY